MKLIKQKPTEKTCGILCDSPSKREKKVKFSRGLKTCKSILDIELQNKRMMGVEPTSPAWKAGVIAVIRHPQDSDII